VVAGPGGRIFISEIGAPGFSADDKVTQISGQPNDVEITFIPSNQLAHKKCCIAACIGQQNVFSFGRSLHLILHCDAIGNASALC